MIGKESRVHSIAKLHTECKLQRDYGGILHLVFTEISHLILKLAELFGMFKYL